MDFTDEIPVLLSPKEARALAPVIVFVEPVTEVAFKDLAYPDPFLDTETEAMFFNPKTELILNCDTLTPQLLLRWLVRLYSLHFVMFE